MYLHKLRLIQLKYYHIDAHITTLKRLNFFLSPLNLFCCCIGSITSDFSHKHLHIHFGMFLPTDKRSYLLHTVLATFLFLKVNRKKTSAAHISKVKYLGYAFYRYKGKCKYRVHPKSVAKIKDKIRELTKRNNGWGNEYRAMKLTQFVRGWVNYFLLADMKGLMSKTDEWLR